MGEPAQRSQTVKPVVAGDSRKAAQEGTALLFGIFNPALLDAGQGMSAGERGSIADRTEYPQGYRSAPLTSKGYELLYIALSFFTGVIRSLKAVAYSFVAITSKEHFSYKSKDICIGFLVPAPVT